VFRRGVAVRRPAPRHAAAVHAFLAALRDAGFAGAPAPRRISDEGWEELEFIHGDVALPPYPWWSMGDPALASVGGLLRRYHAVAARVPVDRSVVWPTDLADPRGGDLLCHGDVCPENVVFRDGAAVALIDFDFAAPGRPLWDLVMTARYWVPMLDPTSAAATGRDHLDPVRRLRVLVDAYGLDAGDRASFMAVLAEAHVVCRAFVTARVEVGLPAFVDALAATGGWERWDRAGAWIATEAERFTDALLAG
jgi:hypothetical protein